jgi:hypothetical protein
METTLTTGERVSVRDLDRKYARLYPENVWIVQRIFSDGCAIVLAVGDFLMIHVKTSDLVRIQ